jgi:hypothetical protein
MPRAIKIAANGDLDILAVPYGGPLAGKDLDGEFFSERTDLCLDWFPTHRPLLYNHGLDGEIETTPIGKADASSAHQDDAGWWVRAQLDKAGRYWQHINQLIEADGEKLFASSGSLPHLVRRAKSGEILRWPWVELSLTTTPANLFATVTPASAKAHYKAAGLTPPPTIDADDTRSYADLLDRLTDDVGDFAEMTQRLTLGRTKVGRPQVSDQRRERLTSLRKRLRELDSDLKDLLSETEPKRAEPGADAPAEKAANLNAIYRAVTERRAWLARELAGV